MIFIAATVLAIKGEEKGVITTIGGFPSILDLLIEGNALSGRVRTPNEGCFSVTTKFAIP